MPSFTIFGAGAAGTVFFDAEDADRINGHRWRLTAGGYAMASIDGRSVLMHRLLCDPPPREDEVVDHINRDRLDNRRGNLRAVSRAVNQANRDHPMGAAGCRGVCRMSDGRWRVRFKRNGQAIELGKFSRRDDAVRVAQNWLANEDPHRV
jgi:hypothetical protein